MVAAAAARTAYFSSARSPGVVLRVSRIVAPVPSSASTNRRVSVAMPERRPRRLSAVRSPVRTARRGPRGARRPSGRSDRVAVGGERLEAHGRDRARGRRSAATSRPQTTPGSLSRICAVQVASAGTTARSSGRRCRRPPRARRDRRSRQLHRSSTGSCPGRRTTCASKRGSWSGSRRGSARRGSPRARARSRRRGARAGGRSGAAARGPARRGRGRRPPRAPGAARASRSALGGRGRGGWLGHAQPWLVERGERGAAAEDEALEQRVRGQAVRAVDAGAGALAGRVEARGPPSARRGR